MEKKLSLCRDSVSLRDDLVSMVCFSNSLLLIPQSPAFEVEWHAHSEES